MITIDYDKAYQIIELRDYICIYLFNNGDYKHFQLCADLLRTMELSNLIIAKSIIENDKLFDII